jgi:Flp pilus assembly protein TadD
MAAQYLKDALDLEPNYATAHAHLAWCHQIGFHHGGLDGADKTEGLRHARMATTAEVDDATALAVGALVIGLLAHDWVAAFNAIERAVSLNPSSSAAYHHGAFLYGINGQSVLAAKYARRALRLSPFDPLAYHAHMALAFAAIQEDRYDEAVAHGAKLAQISPNFASHVMCYAVALALAGRMDEARPVWARALEIEPAMSISTGRSIRGSDASGLGDKIDRALRLLGVSE